MCVVFAPICYTIRHFQLLYRSEPCKSMNLICVYVILQASDILTAKIMAAKKGVVLHF